MIYDKKVCILSNFQVEYIYSSYLFLKNIIMSRIGKLPVNVPSNVKIEINNLSIKVIGPKGELSKTFNGKINLQHLENQVVVQLNDPENPTKFDKAMYGTARSIIANMVKGVTTGFEISLTLTGIGYKAAAIENGINLNYGYSHMIKFFIRPEDKNLVTISVPKHDILIINSIDKALVGLYANKLKNIRKFNIYKGKGISVTGEKITLKKRKKS